MTLNEMLYLENKKYSEGKISKKKVVKESQNFDSDETDITEIVRVLNDEFGPNTASEVIDDDDDEIIGFEITDSARDRYSVEVYINRNFNNVHKRNIKGYGSIYVADLVESKKKVTKEDTVKKSNGKWTNRGDDGTEHGEFDTKKKADAQRKAMFANKESLDLDLSKCCYDKK